MRETLKLERTARQRPPVNSCSNSFSAGVCLATSRSHTPCTCALEGGGLKESLGPDIDRPRPIASLVVAESSDTMILQAFCSAGTYLEALARRKQEAPA